MKNREIAKVFAQIANILSLNEEENVFRLRAYRRASRIVRDYPEEMKQLVGEGEDLQEIEGIGEDLEGKIKKMVKAGKCEFLERIKKEVGKGLVELLEVEGLGPKSVARFKEELGVRDKDELLRAARAKKIRELDGFGEKSEREILRGLEGFEGKKRRKRKEVEPIVEELVEHLKDCKRVEKVEVAGSYRRKEETVGDLDILVEGKEGEGILNCFVNYKKVKRIIGRGSTKASVVLENGLQVDVRVVDGSSFGSALQYFTGSKDHNIKLRKKAKMKGLKLNEYGVYRGEKRIAGENEKGVYEVLGVEWVPPEKRS